ncbi:zinc-binding dehydrogenase [Psychrobacter sp. T6-6]|uniref:zinc-binding dehydrogenase n=1 Tax=Psychrobacter sp. T6-6 TaxID=3457452 RepID=UPI003FD62B20
MRSAIHNSFGKPSDVLSVGDSPMPQPAANEVRIKTILSPIHNHDLLTVSGQYGYKPEMPAIGGSEALGIIDAVGDDVTDLSVGQRVACASVHETWAEYFVAPADMVFVIPDSIKDELAAQLIAMPLSALMLLEFLEVDSGQWIIHNAANGAVGKTLAMLAAARGVNTINLVRSKESLEELTALDIKNNVVTADDDWKDQVRAIIGDDKITAAVDSVGGDSSNELLSLLGSKGTLVSFGIMSGKPMALDAGSLIFKQAVVKGFWGSKTSQEMDLDNKQRLIDELLERASNGDLKLPIEAIYSLDDITTAVSGKVQSSKKGKVILKP